MQRFSKMCRMQCTQTVSFWRVSQGTVSSGWNELQVLHSQGVREGNRDERSGLISCELVAMVGRM